MKILWKNVLWNHTVRYWWLAKYYLSGSHKSKWPVWYYPLKRFYTQEAREKFMEIMDKEISQIEFQSPEF